MKKPTVVSLCHKPSPSPDSQQSTRISPHSTHTDQAITADIHRYTASSSALDCHVIRHFLVPLGCKTSGVSIKVDNHKWVSRFLTAHQHNWRVPWNKLLTASILFFNPMWFSDFTLHKYSIHIKWIYKIWLIQHVSALQLVGVTSKIFSMRSAKIQV